MVISDERAKRLAFTLRDADRLIRIMMDLWGDTEVYPKFARKLRLEDLVVCQNELNEEIKVEADGRLILKEDSDD
jgi:hypothetical protein